MMNIVGGTTGLDSHWTRLRVIHPEAQVVLTSRKLTEVGGGPEKTCL